MDKLLITSSPHIRSNTNVQSIMRDVIIALLPAVAMGTYLFGIRALLVVLVSAAASVFFEWGYRRMMKKNSTIHDLSAAVTGVLLGLCMPPSIPYWVPVIGAFFAIVVVKQLYGGIGKNFLNPALAGRCFLFSWPVLMTTWMEPLSYKGEFFSLNQLDVVTGATPLADMAQGVLPQLSLMDCLIGIKGGSIGEVSAIALIIGGAYLLYRGVINLRIPGSYVLTVAVLTFLFPQGNPRFAWMAYQLFSGGLMIGAMFMANDYATSPTTKKGQIIYGIGCGALTVFIRYFGSYAEGVSFAILIMNVCTWLIDKYTLPRRFGVYPEKKEAK
ncbi:MAG: RnfABCDGE type electron transport complex subunit D [Ruminococcaceae bacterium]|nr:RnfABCDGE type electron transport complex subunit D [Oscillospiraceae bacterium]